MRRFTVLRSVPPEQRFWAQTKRVGDCVEFIVDDVKGYGRFRHNNRRIPAHRYAYTIERGAIPRGKLVLHHCDNPRCVNVKHLYLGSHSDNQRDKYRRIRGRSRMTAEMIREARRLYKRHERGSLQKIAIRLGVSTVVVYNAATRKTFYWID